MSGDEVINLEKYLRNNWNLPSIQHITHIDSIYSEALQVASQLANAMKDVIVGTANDDRRELLNFVVLKDITRP